MNAPEFERFSRIVEEDEALRDELWVITDPAQFVGTVVRCARERGIMVIDSEVWAAFNAGRLAWLATQTS